MCVKGVKWGEGGKVGGEVCERQAQNMGKTMEAGWVGPCIEVHAGDETVESKKV